MKLQSNMFFGFSVLLQLFALSYVYAGEGNVGNGTDRLPYNHGSAWFTGVRHQIRYCTIINADFGVSNETAEKSIVDAYAIWKKYLDVKLQWDYFLTTNLQRMPNCDGTEDLKFYFGPNNEEILKYKGKYVSPIAFSARTQFDDEKGWGKGFVWVGNATETKVDWSLANNLLGIVLHEVGHILGCSHVEGTIMRPNNDYMLSTDGNSSGRRFLSQIDGERDLFLCSHCAFNFTGTLAFGYEKAYNRPDTTQVELEQIFKVFVGRALKGQARAQISGTENLKDAYRYKFELSDDLGTILIPITFFENGDWAQRPFDTRFDREGSVFKIISHDYSSVFSSMGMWAYGMATLPDGKVVPIMLERNMASALSLKYVVNGGIHNLFRGDR